jgi:hypothetical protein
LTVITGVGVELTVSLVAVIVAVPTPTAVTVVVPFVELAGVTVSTAVLLEVQSTVRPVRIVPTASLVVAVSDCILPTTIGVVGAESVTELTGAGVTVIEDVPLTPSLVAVIVTGPPSATPVTRPLFASTVATAVLFELHVTVRPASTLPAASLVTAVSCCVGVTPITRLTVSGLTVTVATGTGLTVIKGVVAAGADSLVAVIVAVPGPTAVSVTVAPLDVLTEVAALTVSTAVLLETQLTVRPTSVLLLPSFGTAVSTWVPPTTTNVVGDERVTDTTGTGLTVITGVVAVLVSLVAVIVAVPTPAAVTVVVPFVELAGFTVSTAVLLEVQATVRPVSTFPFASFITAVSDCVPPATIGVVGEESVTELTGARVTVIEDVPLTPSLVAVIVIGPPAATLVTRPLAFTVATAVLFEIQVTTRLARMLPFASLVTAVSCCVGVTPITRLTVAGVTVTVATGTGLIVITGVVAVLVSLVAVIVAVPGPTAVSVTVAPLDVLTELAALTVSAEVLLETQLTVRPTRLLLLASFGTAVSTWVPPTTIGVVGDERVSVTTGTNATVIDDVPVFVSLVAVIVTGPPTATPLTKPPASTVAIAELLDAHVTSRPVSTLLAPSRSVAASCCVPPTTRLAVGGLTVTVLTGASITVIEDVPFTPSLVAVIVTGPPTATPVTRPLTSTVATAVLFELHVTARPVSTLPAASLVTAVSC